MRLFHTVRLFGRPKYLFCSWAATIMNILYEIPEKRDFLVINLLCLFESKTYLKAALDSASTVIHTMIEK